jgi:hypothetical protein
LNAFRDWFTSRCRNLANGANALFAATASMLRLDEALSFAQCGALTKHTRCASAFMTSDVKHAERTSADERRLGFVADAVSVSAFGLIEGLHDVYNLSVEEAPEFVANGVLVHNCYPSGKWKDQVDAAGGAFNKLAKNDAYITDYARWL